MMCDAIDYAIVKIKKEVLVVVFTFDKFIAYLIESKVIVYTHHPTIKFLVEKKNAKPRLIK